MIEQEFLTEIGLDPDTAEALAELIAEETAAEAKQLAEKLMQEKNARLPRLLSVTPGGAVTATREGFAQMSYSERARLHRESPMLYRELAAK